jgi:hypothetical protein
MCDELVLIICTVAVSSRFYFSKFLRGFGINGLKFIFNILVLK